jgi:hypothetical protein
VDTGCCRGYMSHPPYKCKDLPSQVEHHRQMLAAVENIGTVPAAGIGSGYLVIGPVTQQVVPALDYLLTGVALFDGDQHRAFLLAAPSRVVRCRLCVMAASCQLHWPGFRA